jgi:hypothetical protein
LNVYSPYQGGVEQRVGLLGALSTQRVEMLRVCVTADGGLLHAVHVLASHLGVEVQVACERKLWNQEITL